MYRGENQEQYIYEKKNFPTFFHCLEGWYPPKCLKGFLWGSLLLRKGAWFCFGVHQRFAKLDKIDRGENV